MSDVEIIGQAPPDTPRSEWALLREAAGNRLSVRLWGVEYRPTTAQTDLLVKQLATTVQRLADTATTVLSDLERQHPDMPSELVRDPNGRYVLMDALETLAKAQAALMIASTRR